MKRAGEAAGRWIAAVGVAAALAAAGGPAASADWLVLRDGTRVETDGPWRVKGRLVVFERPGGQLTSLRLSEVDLDASDQATAAALAAPAEPQPAEAAAPPRKATVVITDADIPKANLPPPAAGGEAAGEGAEAAEPAAPAASDLAVLSWEQAELPSGDGLRIYGTLQNQGRKTITNAGMRVLLYDADGRLIESREAELSRTELPTDFRADFTVSFTGVFAFAAAKFEPRYRTFEPRVTPSGDAEAVAEPPPTAR